jgi:hypothetical protein
MLFREIIAVFSETHKITLHEKRADIFIVESGGAYSKVL